MLRHMQLVFAGVALCAFFSAAVPSSYAGTIIKLNLGDVSPDIEFDGTTLSTAEDDNIPPTTGDQNTAVEYVGFLDIPFLDIPTPIASFTLDDLIVDGAASMFFGSLLLQNFDGGTMDLYSPANTLLLSGTLTNSALTGVVGPPGVGALFTTSFGNVTGGTLAPLLIDDTLTLSMNLTDVNGGAGFSINPLNSALNPFTADAAVNIAADPIPEPAGIILLVTGLALAVTASRRVGR